MKYSLHTNLYEVFDLENHRLLDNQPTKLPIDRKLAFVVGSNHVNGFFIFGFEDGHCLTLVIQNKSTTPKRFSKAYKFRQTRSKEQSVINISFHPQVKLLFAHYLNGDIEVS
jgi:hypothetical protein